MITYDDGFATLLKLKGSAIPKALLLALPSLFLTTALYAVDGEVSLDQISVGDVTVGQVAGLKYVPS